MKEWNRRPESIYPRSCQVHYAYWRHLDIYCGELPAERERTGRCFALPSLSRWLPPRSSQASIMQSNEDLASDPSLSICSETFELLQEMLVLNWLKVMPGHGWHIDVATETSLFFSPKSLSEALDSQWQRGTTGIHVTR